MSHHGLAVAGVESDYLALDEAARVELLRRELANRRPLASPYADYSAETRSELDIVRALLPDYTSDRVTEIEEASLRGAARLFE